jgi:integrase
VQAALNEDCEFSAFCLTLAVTGARISEVLALTGRSIDGADEGLVFRTLKQRNQTTFRFVPAPAFLLERLLVSASGKDERRLWSLVRTYAWKRIKSVMRKAGIVEGQCKPKALRHGFAVEAALNGVPINVPQRWMGHARLETTAIYTSVLGEEERLLACRTWRNLDGVFSASMVNYASPLSNSSTS